MKNAAAHVSGQLPFPGYRRRHPRSIPMPGPHDPVLSGEHTAPLAGKTRRAR